MKSDDVGGSRRVPGSGRAVSGRTVIRLSVTLLVVAFVAVAAGCGSDDDSGATGGAASTTAATTSTGATSTGASTGTSTASGTVEGKEIAYVAIGDVNPGAKEQARLFREYFTQRGAKVTYLQDPYDSATSVRNCNTAVARKPDLIVSVPIDPNALVPCLRRAKDAGIKVIMAFIVPPDAVKPYVTGNVPPDDTESAKNLAKNMIDGLKEEGIDSGNVVVVSGGKSTGGYLRVDEFRKVMAATPEFKIVEDIADPSFTQAKTQALVQPLFAKYRSRGGIQAVVTYGDDQAFGVIQAARQANVPVGVDNKGLIIVSSVCSTNTGTPAAVGKGDLYASGTATSAEAMETINPYVERFLKGEDVPAVQTIPQGYMTRDDASKWEGKCY